VAPQSFRQLLAGAAVLLALSSLLGGCKPDQRESHCAQDRTTLRAVIQEDQRVAQILHEADDLALRGRPLDAAERIDQGAKPAMDEVVTDARRFEPRTRWGASRKKDLLSVVETRQKRIDSYVRALRAESLQSVLAAMEAQRDLEKRALAVQKAVASAPTPASGACDPP